MAESHVVALLLNWRLCDATLQVLADLQQAGHAPLTVLLLDNGSNDGSAERLAAAASAITEGDPAARQGGAPAIAAELLAFDTNLGYCAAMNRGIARAAELGADHVLFLNNDARLPAGFLAPLVSVLDHDPRLACVAPTIVDAHGRAWCQGGGVRFRPNLVTLFGQGGPPAPQEHGPEAVEFQPGACALYRLADLDAVGRLDEDYFMYWEDVDLGARLRARGRGVLWLPWVRVVHEPSRSSGGGRSPLRKYMSAVNTVRFLRRHGTARLWLAFVLFDVLLWPFTLLSGTGPRAALAKARGLVHGVCGRKVTVAAVRHYLPEGTA